MATIPTLTGPMDSAHLGVALVHEHLNFRTGLSQCPPEFLDKNMDYHVRLLQDAAAVGVNTIVDCGPFPDLEQIVTLRDRATGVNIVLCTGAYLEHGTPEPIRSFSEEEMAAHMRRDLTDGYEGFEDAGLRAGVIKVAARTAELTDWEQKNFRAAARVQRELQVPIVTHACAGAREQMALLREHGAHIPATFYSHVECERGWDGRDREQEVAYLAEVAAAGGYLLFNNFDFEFDTPWEDLVFLMDALEARGHGDRVLYSIDTNWTVDQDGRIWHEQEKKHPKTGKRNYAYAITHATPRLMQSGVSLQRVWRYLVDNPRRYFEAFET